MRHRRKWLALGLLTLLAACSTAPTRSARTQSTPPSGFLANYSLLVTDPHDATYRHYVAPDVDIRQYHGILIDEPVFVLNTGNAYGQLDPGRLQAISGYYESRMATALGKHYRVATAPGPGVLRVRTAVVGLLEVHPPFKVRDLVPVKAVFEAARLVTGTNPLVLRMSMESEALDSQSGKLIGEAVDSRESGQTVTGASAPPSDAQIHSLIDFWVDRFVARLDRVNGYAAARGD